MIAELKKLSNLEHLQRQEVIREALTWIPTSFKHEARVKNVAIDCGRFLIAVYCKCGLMENYEPPHVPEQWHLHADAPAFDAEMYERQLRKFACEISGTPLPGDIAMFWWGHAYSHSGIVIDWPTSMVHCFFINGVQLVDPTIDPYLKRYAGSKPPKFFSVWPR